MSRLFIIKSLLQAATVLFVVSACGPSNFRAIDRPKTQKAYAKQYQNQQVEPGYDATKTAAKTNEKGSPLNSGLTTRNETNTTATPNATATDSRKQHEVDVLAAHLENNIKRLTTNLPTEIAMLEDYILEKGFYPAERKITKLLGFEIKQLDDRSYYSGLFRLKYALDHRLLTPNPGIGGVDNLVIGYAETWQALEPLANEYVIVVACDATPQTMANFINEQLSRATVKKQNMFKEKCRNLAQKWHDLVEVASGIDSSSCSTGLEKLDSVLLSAPNLTPQYKAWEKIVIGKKNRALFEENASLKVQVGFASSPTEILNLLQAQPDKPSFNDYNCQCTYTEKSKSWSPCRVSCFFAQRPKLSDTVGEIERKLSTLHLKSAIKVSCCFEPGTYCAIDVAKCSHGLRSLMTAIDQFGFPKEYDFMYVTISSYEHNTDSSNVVLVDYKATPQRIHQHLSWQNEISGLFPAGL